MFDADTYNIPHWEADSDMEPEVFTEKKSYDAKNRPIQEHTGRLGGTLSVVDYTYNQAGLLREVRGNIAQKGPLVYVRDIQYDEKGQRKAIFYGNGSVTRYGYDETSFRLVRIRTVNTSETLQDLNYTYDSVGNLTSIENLAQDTIFFNNQMTVPGQTFVYDALYRLITAKGREHMGQAGVHASIPDSRIDHLRTALPHPGNGTALQKYRQHYTYDATGNLLNIRHLGGLGSLTHRWTKTLGYNNNDGDRQRLGVAQTVKKNNQLLDYTQGADVQRYTHDPHGNMEGLQPNTPQQFGLTWNCFDRLTHVSIIQGTAHYWYTITGTRNRKTITDGNRITKERVYFGNLEVYREFDPDGSVRLERESFHIAGNAGRVALVDTKTIAAGSDTTADRSVRYQYADHLGSSALELDASGALISYEEYYPYGTTSYQAVDQSVKAAAKRYRYTGMERDEESGMNYHTARYYLPWLGRWSKPDPIGTNGGINLYEYCDSNPINKIDPGGLDGFSLSPSRFSLLDESDRLRLDPIDPDLTVPEVSSPGPVAATDAGSGNTTAAAPDTTTTTFGPLTIDNGRLSGYPLIPTTPLSESGDFFYAPGRYFFTDFPLVSIISFSQYTNSDQRMQFGQTTGNARSDSYTALRVGNDRFHLDVGYRSTMVSNDASLHQMQQVEEQRVGVLGLQLGPVGLAYWNDHAFWPTGDGGDQGDTAGASLSYIPNNGIDMGSGWLLNNLSLNLRMATGIPVRGSEALEGGDVIYQEVIRPDISRGDLFLQGQLSKGNYNLDIGAGIDSGLLRHAIQSDLVHRNLDIPEFRSESHFGAYLFVRGYFGN
ncbi:RHS repeat-associated core domain-containing protein [Maribacter sp. 2-571]|uniref:RHS repeat-associated core domain-containing protein n=1 Tax=Maribacter sp. 2-571 TaxID=3417569 RepID=UPI003D33358F